MKIIQLTKKNVRKLIWIFALVIVISMCGIIGILSKNKISSKDALLALKRLEYRGYDSFGFANVDGVMEKFVGEIDKSFDEINNISSNLIIAHTRWATHGNVSEKNTHPHFDCNKNLFIVHNGIIENYQELKRQLQESGHEFTSDTDSEVIAHYFEEKLKTKPIEKVIQDFFSAVNGTFAVLLIRKGENRIYAFKRDSPLVLGLLSDGFIVASDIYAFSDKSNKAILFEDDEFAIISSDSSSDYPGGYQFFDKFSRKIEKNIQTFEWMQSQELMVEEHFMIKEIHEQTTATERLILSLNGEQKDKIRKLKNLIENHKRILFVACGTAYHASLLGSILLRRVGINSQAIIASEFESFANIDEDTLIIAITQSGETMDVIKALKFAKEKNREVKIASIVNVPHSTIERLSDFSINICAGQEICVASTKAFTNQILVLLHLAKLFGLDVDINRIPKDIEEAIRYEPRIKELARELKNHKDIYIIGRGLGYPVAKEIALKIKEISYIHAEGMMGGELKHGTIALVEEGTPVISIMPKNDNDITSNTKEVEARGARVIAISNNDFNSDGNSDSFKIDAENESFVLCANVIGQLLTYHIAREKKLPIDKPRNLAKSVTVK